MGSRDVRDAKTVKRIDVTKKELRNEIKKERKSDD
jgi:hypothetical protein